MWEANQNVIKQQKKKHLHNQWNQATIKNTQKHIKQKKNEYVVKETSNKSIMISSNDNFKPQGQSFDEKLQ